MTTCSFDYRDGFGRANQEEAKVASAIQIAKVLYEWPAFEMALCTLLVVVGSSCPPLSYPDSSVLETALSIRPFDCVSFQFRL